MRDLINSLTRDLRLVADGTLYFGTASFCVFDSQVDDDDPTWAPQVAYQYLGYDCWAFIGHLNQGDSCVGAFVLPFGPWTMEHPEVVERLDRTPEGAVIDLPGLLKLFPHEVRVVDTFSSTDDVIIGVGFVDEELEMPFEDDKAVQVDLKGDLTTIAYADDEDWVDGPILILRSNLVTSQLN